MKKISVILKSQNGLLTVYADCERENLDVTLFIVHDDSFQNSCNEAIKGKSRIQQFALPVKEFCYECNDNGKIKNHVWEQWEKTILSCQPKINNFDTVEEYQKADDDWQKENIDFWKRQGFPDSLADKDLPEIWVECPYCKGTKYK